MAPAFRPAETLALVWPSPEPRRLTGAVELRLAEAVATAASRAEQAGAIIMAAFQSVAGQPLTPARLTRLSTGIRAWLLARAVAVLGGESGWFQADCTTCGRPFDFALRLSDLPRGDAGAGFPVATVATSLGPRQFEVPNGGHEAALAHLAPGQDARRALVSLIGLSDSHDADAHAFTEADLTAIETALDDIAPDVADRIHTSCPACKSATEALIDPLSLPRPGTAHLLRETHLIARSYGWREAAILALPSDRRRSYARMIAAERRGS